MILNEYSFSKDGGGKSEPQPGSSAIGAALKSPAIYSAIAAVAEAFS